MGANIIDATPDDMSVFWLYDGEPVSQSSLTANLVCRVVFGLLSNLLMWVPLRLLHRNGELAAVVLIIATMIYNVGTVINGLIWRTDDTASWWEGYGYCDVFIYLNYPILTIYTACVFAIMRNLAAQISLMRVNTPSQREKRKHNIIQCLIIFPVPVLWMAWVYPAGVHRYFLTTLSGCSWQPTRTWPTLVFWCIPQPAYVVGAAYYAGMFRFRFVTALFPSFPGKMEEGLFTGVTPRASASIKETNTTNPQASPSGASDSSPETPSPPSPPPTAAPPPAPAAPSAASTS